MVLSGRGNSVPDGERYSGRASQSGFTHVSATKSVTSND